MIDTHCHLDAAEFAADRDAVVEAARQAGVRQIVVPAVAVDQFAEVKSCCARYADCLPAYGIHPLAAANADDASLNCLKDWLTNEAPVAVGEIGLDFYVGNVDRAHQTWLFREQLRLAREFDLPVLLHVRRAVDAVLVELRRLRVRGGIAHAFNGSAEQAAEFIKLGFKLGFGGSLTFNGSTRIRRLAAELPIESLVLETDAPDIPPAWLNGGRNSPAELPRIAQTLAEFRGISLQELVDRTSANALAALPGIGTSGD